jgi:hypothetical protein
VLKLDLGCCVEELKLLTSKYRMDRAYTSLNTNFHLVPLHSQKTYGVQLLNLCDVL